MVISNLKLSNLESFDFTKNPLSTVNFEQNLTFFDVILQKEDYEIVDKFQPLICIHPTKKLYVVPECVRRYFTGLQQANRMYKRLIESIFHEIELWKLQKRINLHFFNHNLITQAFTLKIKNQEFNNERLEFLGDSILDVVVIEALFRNLPNIKDVFFNSF